MKRYIRSSYEDDEAAVKKKEQDFIKFAKAHPSTPSLIIDKYIDNQETCSYYYGMEFDEDGRIFDSLPGECKQEMHRRYNSGEYDDYDDEDASYWETGVGRAE